MSNILDVVAVVTIVPTKRYGDLEVTGLSIEGIVCLIKSHPELVDLFQGGKLEVSMGKILELGLEVTASFLAAGLGHPENPEVIKKCKAFNPEDALAVGKAIIDESFPGGVENFFKRVQSLAEKAPGLMTRTQPESASETAKENQAENS